MAQRLCLDAEALLAAVAPLLQQMGDMQGFQHPVNLSVEALIDFSSELLEVPADLRQLKGRMRKLTVENTHGGTREMPEWLGEHVHLENLYLKGPVGVLPTFISQLTLLETLRIENCSALREMSSSLGDLQALKHLSLKDIKGLAALPASFDRLTSLETLHILECHALWELPSSIGTLTQLRNLTVIRSVLTDVA